MYMAFILHNKEKEDYEYKKNTGFILFKLIYRFLSNFNKYISIIYFVHLTFFSAALKFYQNSLNWKIW